MSITSNRSHITGACAWRRITCKHSAPAATTARVEKQEIIENKKRMSDLTNVTRDKPLHSLLGEYIKRLKDAGHIESEMTLRILKTSISNLEAFNDVRNNQSLAHDNPILNYDEAPLIFNNVASSIRFLRSLEQKIKTQLKNAEPDPWAITDGDIPF